MRLFRCIVCIHSLIASFTLNGYEYRFFLDTVFCFFQQRNEAVRPGFDSANFNSSLNFGKHGTGGKMSLFIYCLGFCVQVIQPLFFRLSEVNSNLFNCSENNQEISVQILC